MWRISANPAPFWRGRSRRHNQATRFNRSGVSSHNGLTLNNAQVRPLDTSSQFRQVQKASQAEKVKGPVMTNFSQPTIMAPQWPYQKKEVPFLSDELHQCLFLLVGFLLLAFAQSLLQFVMIGLLGLVLIPITVGMIALIGYFSRGAKVNGTNSRFGFSVLLVGLVLLTIVTWQVGFFSLNIAFISKGKPTGPGFDGSLFAVGKLIMGGIAASVAIGSGLGVRSGKRRVGALGLAMAFLTLPCTVLFFVVLFWLGSPIST